MNYILKNPDYEHLDETMESVWKRYESNMPLCLNFHFTNFRWLVIAYSTDLIWQNRNIIVMLQDVLAGSTGLSTISNKLTREKGGIRYAFMFLNKILKKQKQKTSFPVQKLQKQLVLIYSTVIFDIRNPK